MQQCSPKDAELHEPCHRGGCNSSFETEGLEVVVAYPIVRSGREPGIRAYKRWAKKLHLALGCSQRRKTETPNVEDPEIVPGVPLLSRHLKSEIGWSSIVLVPLSNRKQPVCLSHTTHSALSVCPQRW